MEKTYERINWENYPSVVTPLNEKNLNKVDSALYEVDNRVLGLDTAKLDKSTANTMVKDVSFDEATGIFTITLLDGTTKTIDTKLEKIAINFRYDKESQKLILTLVDGSEQEVDLSSLISQYEFSDGNIISFSVDSDGKVSAIVKGGSITEDKLQPNFLADVKVEASKAKSSSDSAYDNATIASNSAQEAKTYRDEAKQYRDEVVAVTDVEIATKDKAGLVKGGKTAVSEDGELLFTKTTTDRTLTESHAGGLIINSMDGESQQDGTPTPDTPIDIKSVEVSEIKIKTDGKNLFDYSEMESTWYQKAGSEVYRKVYTLKPNTKYTLSCPVKFNNGASAFCFIISGANLDFAPQSTSNGALPSRTVTTDESGNLTVGAYFYHSSPGISVKDANIQLEEGSIATKYEPYTEKSIQLSAPITLRGIGDVKDVLCKRDGVYGVLREFSTITFNGTEEWKRVKANETNRYYCNLTLDKGQATIGVDDVPIGYCSHFEKATRRNSYVYATDNRYCTYEKNFTISYNTATSLAEFKTWLASNNVTIDFKLETPTFEPLPLADQIALRQLETFDTVTYISTDSEIEPIMEVEYGTSKVGAYAIKGMNDIEVEKFRLNETEETIENMQHSTEIIRATLNSGVTEITISDNRITENSVLSFYTSIYGVSPKTATVANGSVTLTFDAQEENIEVGVRVDG